MVASGGLFAPTIKHHKGTFYIVCTNAARHGRPTIQFNNFVISTTDIWKGEWSIPVPIDFHGIDPGLFFDDDGKVYFQGCYSIRRDRQPTCTIKQFEIDLVTGKALSEHREIWGGFAQYDTEGPHIYKVGKYYYLLVAEGGTFEHHLLSVARSENIWGPYESYQNNPILTADGKDGEYIQNTGHGELFEDAHGQWWAAVLGVRNEPTCQPLGRETFLAKVDWTDDGWPVVRQPKMQFSGPAVVRGQGKGKETWPASPLSPRLEDLYIGEPDVSKYTLPADPKGTGSFILVPGRDDLSSPASTPTFIGQRQRGLNSVATVSINLEASSETLKEGGQAGLSVYKDHLRHVSLVFDFESRSVKCHSVNVATGLDRWDAGFVVNGDSKRLQLSITSSPAEYRFAAKAESGDCPPEGGGWVEVGFCETRELAAREMTGPIFGIFAVAATAAEAEAGGVVFSDFIISQ